MANGKIGIKLADGAFYPILDEDRASRKRLVLTTVKDGQRSVQIDLYRGQGTRVEEARYIGSLVIENIEPGPRGKPDIRMDLGLDAEGTLSALATDPSSGEERSLSVSLSTLKEEEIFSIPDFEIGEEEEEGTGGFEEAIEAEEIGVLSEAPEPEETDFFGGDDEGFEIGEGPVESASSARSGGGDEEFDLPELLEGDDEEGFEIGEGPQTGVRSGPKLQPDDDFAIPDLLNGRDEDRGDGFGAPDDLSEDLGGEDLLSEGAFSEDSDEQEIKPSERPARRFSFDDEKIEETAREEERGLLASAEEARSKRKSPALIPTILLALAALVLALGFSFFVYRCSLAGGPQKDGDLAVVEGPPPVLVQEITSMPAELPSSGAPKAAEAPQSGPSARPESASEGLPPAPAAASTTRKQESSPVAAQNQAKGTPAVSAAPAPAKPQAQKTSQAATPAASARYRIKWGDTLWDIAYARYGNPWLYPRIAKANKIKNPDRIIAGAWISIPPR